MEEKDTENMQNKEKKKKSKSQSPNEIRSIKKVGVYRTSSNFVNAVLGSGVLNIPKALERSGYFSGVLLLIFVCVIGDYISINLIKTSRKVKVKSYEELSEKAWGKWLYYVTCIACFLFSLGALIGYISLIYNTSNSLMQTYATDFFNSNSFIKYVTTLSIVFVIITPLSLLKDLAMLSIGSIISVCTFGLIMVITTVVAAQDGQYRKGFNSFDFNDLLSAVGTFSFAMVCVDSLLPVHQGLENSTQERWNKVSHISIWTLAGIYGVFSTIAYFLIPNLNDYVLNSDSLKNNTAIMVCKGFLGLTIILTYPVVLHVARSYVFPLFVSCLGPIESLSNQTFYILHVSTTISIIISTTIMGIYINKLDFIINLTGLFASTIVGFVIPVIIIFKIRTFRVIWGEFKASFGSGVQIKTRYEGIVNFCFPIIIFIFGLIGFGIGVPLLVKDYLKEAE